MTPPIFPLACPLESGPTKLLSCGESASVRWHDKRGAAAYPERFAQEALGHNSKAVHRAYAKRALMKIPSLEDYEQRAAMKTDLAA